MRTEQLEYLIDIVKTGSINKTAQHFFISQQAVSSSIRQLEHELGYPLLNRSTTGVSLTQYGRIAVDYARQTLLLRSALFKQLAQADTEGQIFDDQPIHIHCASVILNMLLPDSLDRLPLNAKADAARIILGTPSEAFEAVVQNHCDLALISTNQAFFNRMLTSYADFSLNIISLMKEPLIICTSAGSPYADLETIEAELYSNSPHTIFAITPVEGYAVRNDQSPYQNSISVSNDADFHKKMLLQNNAIMTLMPLTAYKLFFNQRQFIMKPLAIDVAFIHAIVLPAHPRPIILTLAERIQKHCQAI